MRALPVYFIFPTFAASFSLSSSARTELAGKRSRTVGDRVVLARRAFIGDDAVGDALIGEDPSCPFSVRESAESSTSIYAALRAREKQINLGVGRRYVTKTQQGFLNIHADPNDGPFCVSNIVGQLVEGQHVTSVGEPHGNWVKHDAGGWSIGKFNGVTWLELLDE